ncbi:adenylate kinase [Streptomyces sp. NPDC058464]|uniref:adenylate kinase n=1 Tax=Streptomyces sp. NPDC058464 TaxID=3346511 RepID=UPI0036542075
MERILVVGVTGAGKSTLARALSGRLGLRYHEMDALYFDGPGWAVNSRLTEDVSRRVVMPRVLRRSLRRTVTCESLFGGNRETWTGRLSREHPAWWAWSQHGTRRREVGSRTRDPRFAPLDTRRFGHPDDTAAWLAAL